MDKPSLASLIVANMLPEEFAKFHEARISYSGSTGAGAKPEMYPGGVAPYIATYVGMLPEVVKALGWSRFEADINPSGQWIVRCTERPFKYSPTPREDDSAERFELREV